MPHSTVVGDLNSTKMAKMDIDDVVDLSLNSGRDSGLSLTQATVRDLRALAQNSGLTIMPAPPPNQMSTTTTTTTHQQQHSGGGGSNNANSGGSGGGRTMFGGGSAAAGMSTGSSSSSSCGGGGGGSGRRSSTPTTTTTTNNISTTITSVDPSSCNPGLLQHSNHHHHAGGNNSSNNSSSSISSDGSFKIHSTVITPVPFDENKEQRRVLRPRTEPKSYAEAPDIVLLPIRMNGKQHNGNIDSETDDEEMPLYHPIKELTSFEIREREKKLRRLRDELRSEETKLILLKKLKQSQYVMKENLALSSASNLPTTNNPLAAIPASLTSKGALSVTPTNNLPSYSSSHKNSRNHCNNIPSSITIW